MRKLSPKVSGKRIWQWMCSRSFVILFAVSALMLLASKALAFVMIVRSNFCALEVAGAAICGNGIGTGAASCAASFLAINSSMGAVLASVREADAENLRYLERLSQSMPSQPVVQLHLGNLWWQSGNPARAVEEWREAEDLDVYFANQSASHVARGDLLQSQRLARIAQMIDPTAKIEKYAMYAGLCKAWRASSRPEKALPWCELAARTLSNGWAQIALAEVQMDMGDYEGALETLQWALDLQRSDSMGAAYHKLAQVYVRMGRLEEGIAAYEAALESGFSSQELYAGLCKAWRASSRPEKALPWCELAARTLSNGWAQIALAEVQMDMGDYEGALETLQWALDLQRSDSMGAAYHKLAQVYVRMGRLEEGIAAYEAALESGFSSQWLYVGLAKALLRAGDLEAACQSFRQAQELGYVPSQEARNRFADCKQ